MEKSDMRKPDMEKPDMEKPDFERLYFELAGKVADGIELLIEAMRESERVYMQSGDGKTIAPFPGVLRDEP